MIEFSSEALREQLTATASMLNGGTLRLYAGKRGSTELLLCQIDIDKSKVTVNEAQCRVGPLTGKVAGTGRATWFRTVSKTGVRVFDGDAGVATGDLILTRVDMLPGDTVAIDSLIIEAV